MSTTEYSCPECDFYSDTKTRLNNHRGHKHADLIPYNNKEKLERFYWDDGFTQEEIADRMGCSQQTICNKLEEFGIETRKDAPRKYSHSTPAYYQIDTGGYERWKDIMRGDKPQKQVKVHQLLACLSNDPHEVFADDTHVHHGSESHLPECEIPWANWEENLQVMDASEHWGHHNKPNEPTEKAATDW